MTTSRQLLVLLPASLVVAACSSSSEPANSPTPGDSGVGNDVAADQPAADSPAEVAPEAETEAASCTLAHPPAAAGTGSGASSVSITAVFTKIDLGDTVDFNGAPGYESLGYDLDGICSVDDASLACQTPTWASGGDPTDAPGGRDNSIGRLLYKGSQGMLTSASVNQGIANGEAPIGIVRVLDYSGEPNDDTVTVEWYVPASAVQGDGGQGGWLVASDYVISGDAGVLDDAGDGSAPAVAGSTLSDPSAYVVNSTLVAHFPDRVLPMMRDGMYEMRQPFFTAKLQTDSSTGKWTLAGTMLSGHIRAPAMLGLMPAVLKKALGMVVCTDGQLYPAIKSMICSYADFLDQGPPDLSTPCDSVSLAYGLSAELTEIVGTTPRNNPKICPDATDPTHDSCTLPP